MGLDQYAYVAARAGQQDEWWESVQRDSSTNELYNPRVTQPRELAYWRKHPNLQGWMEKLWLKKLNIPANASDQFVQNVNPPGHFNGVELELTFDDLNSLEKAVKTKTLPATHGFFFGPPKDDYYRQQDLEFIRQARAELFMGLRVFYNSSW